MRDSAGESMTVMDGRTLDDRELEVLVGILASLEGLIQAEAIDGRALEYFRRRLRSDGYLPMDNEPGEDGLDVRQKIHDLNQRLRYVLGEHDDPSRSLAVGGPELGGSRNPQPSDP